VIYLDNAATTFPKPGFVYKELKKAIKKYGANPGRSGYKMAIETAEKIYETRLTLSHFFNAKSSENVIFTHNCTAALNMCIKGLAKPGGEFVCSSLEHNAVVRPLEKLKKTGLTDWKTAEVDLFDDDKTVDNFNKQITDKTLAVIITFSSNVFGFILPVKKISELCKKRGVPLIVDAAQAAGIIEIDVEKLGIDYLCVAAHKGLYAPAGTGILIVNAKEYPDTLFEGGTGSNSFEFSQPDFLPDRFESGTQNTSSIISLNRSVNEIASVGVNEIYSYEYSLLKKVEEDLREMKNVILYTSFLDNSRLSPVLSFNIKNLPSEQTAALLAEKNICVRAGYHCNPLSHKALGTLDTGTVRISPSFLTKKSDINFTINCVNKLQNK